MLSTNKSEVYTITFHFNELFLWTGFYWGVMTSLVSCWWLNVCHHTRCRNPPSTHYFCNNALDSKTTQNCTQSTPLTAGVVGKKLSLKELLNTVYLCLEATFNYLFLENCRRKQLNVWESHFQFKAAGRSN